MTQAAVKTSGAWGATIPWARVGGVWKPVSNAFARVSSAWTQFFQNFTASASRSSVSKFGSTATLTTASVTITPSGGATPYTYAWTRTSGSSAITANTPSMASTTFSATVALGQAFDAIFNCAVTDANGHTVVVAVAVHIERTI